VVALVTVGVTASSSRYSKLLYRPGAGVFLYPAVLALDFCYGTDVRVEIIPWRFVYN
jgi:hypothetical protein